MFSLFFSLLLIYSTIIAWMWDVSTSRFFHDEFFRLAVLLWFGVFGKFGGIVALGGLRWLW